MTTKVMSWLPLLALPVLASGWIVVNGTMGTCAMCTAIMDTVTGGSSKTAVVDQGGNVHELSAKSFSGETVSFEKFAGKPLLIEFWATWCPPCREQRSVLAEMQDELKDKVTVLAISVDDSPAVAEKYVADKGAIGEELYISGDLINRFEISSIPTLVFVDAAGEVKSIQAGVHSAAKIRKQLKGLSSAPIARSN